MRFSPRAPWFLLLSSQTSSNYRLFGRKMTVNKMQTVDCGGRKTGWRMFSLCFLWFCPISVVLVLGSQIGGLNLCVSRPLAPLSWQGRVGKYKGRIWTWKWLQWRFCELLTYAMCRVSDTYVEKTDVVILVECDVKKINNNDRIN